jgi:two-component system LytT family sensor kinase
MVVKNNTLLGHTLMWSVFIAYEIGFLAYTVGLRSGLVTFAVFYALNICLFYVHAHVILDYAFFKTRAPYMTSIVFILFELAGYLVIKFAIDILLMGRAAIAGQLQNSTRYIAANAWRGIYFIGFSTAYWSMLYMLRFKERNHRMETEQLRGRARTLELENAFLQNQISPHLLFNTLNFIYNSVYLKSEKAGKGVLLLADLMRYSLVPGEENKLVLLEKEVGQIENLIELCRLRFGGELHLHFDQSGKTGETQILPLVLVTLVENMIKHGDLCNHAVPAWIRLEVTPGLLSFEASNLKRGGSPYPKGGLGLKNLEKRLENYYRRNYALHIAEDTRLFTINLSINL